MTLIGRIASLARGIGRRLRHQAGAITAEYTLVTLVGATVALLLLNWAKGGALVDFFQSIFDKVVALFS
jgi:hypothetical protein